MSKSPAVRRLPVLAAALSMAAAGLVAAQPAQAHPHPARCPQLTVSDGWFGDNQDRIQDLIDTYGTCGAGAGHGKKPVAVFDWDNTVVKNDVGDATMYWLLRNSKIQRPARGDWHTTSRYLTDAAATSLAAACPAGRSTTLPTATDTACADEILAVYGEGATGKGAAAFAGFDRRTMEPSYAWLAQLLHGWTPAQVEAFASAARTQNLTAPADAVQTLGSNTKATAWVRYYDQQRDLIRTLQRAGFDVWITSASPEPVVDVWARGAGVAPDHAIGIRSTTQHGRITSHLKGCGSARDGDDSVITYIDGKRCWINQEVFGVRGAAAEGAAGQEPPGVRGRRLRHRRVLPAGRDRAASGPEPQQERADVPGVRRQRRPLDRQPHVHRAQGPEGRALPVRHHRLHRARRNAGPRAARRRLGRARPVGLGVRRLNAGSRVCA